jgi:sodium/bile acid cotransporter 7
MGILFLCTLPSTVQSSIAFTSIAKGNVPAAVCAASASSLLGIFITPALVGLVVTDGSGHAGSAWHTVSNIVLQLLVPFIAGQLLRSAFRRSRFDPAGGVRRVQRSGE